jgi:hypothetical protein
LAPSAAVVAHCPLMSPLTNELGAAATTPS